MNNESLEEVNSLGSITMIGGSDMTFIFNCVNDVGAVVNLTGATVSMKISPYGQSNVTSLTKTGIITSTVGGIWKIVLGFSDTNTLYGVYQCQPKIVDFSGGIFYPGQFILNIVSLIQ